MTPTEVLKMLKSKIDAAGLDNCNYTIETSDIDAINQALLPPICRCENTERIYLGKGKWVKHCPDCGKDWYL